MTITCGLQGRSHSGLGYTHGQPTARIPCSTATEQRDIYIWVVAARLPPTSSPSARYSEFRPTRGTWPGEFRVPNHVNQHRGSVISRRVHVLVRDDIRDFGSVPFTEGIAFVGQIPDAHAEVRERDNTSEEEVKVPCEASSDQIGGVLEHA